MVWVEVSFLVTSELFSAVVSVSTTITTVLVSPVVWSVVVLVVTSVVVVELDFLHTFYAFSSLTSIVTWVFVAEEVVSVVFSEVSKLSVYSWELSSVISVVVLLLVWFTVILTPEST